MMRNLFTTSLCAGLCTASVSAQAPSNRPADGPANSADSVPAAYVYVSASAGQSNRAQVYAFAATARGRLNAVSGSPYPYNVTYLATNGLYLFGSDASGTYIHAYQIDREGTLRRAASTSVIQAKNGCDSAGALFLDHTGATVYNVDYYGGHCSETVYQAFAVEKTTGSLQLVDQAPVGVTGSILSFAANNSYAYGADCGRSNPSIYGYIRRGDGSLARIDSRVPIPAGNPAQRWCPRQAATDAMNHIVIAMYPESRTESGAEGGPYQLATYTQSEDGGLTTSSTAENMPRVAVGEVTDLYTSPSGKLLAVAGTNGLQLFQFNGAGPITAITGLLTRQEVDQMFWDRDDHLYAISQSAGKLWVFTVSPDSVVAAAGSPYAVPGALNLVVQPSPVPWGTSEARIAGPADHAEAPGAIAAAQ
ncbi:MAG TPA: hypothetical protein VGL22_09985 [Terracidiphilus sp.]|jgi:6-phosphogluconolactonase (cycloisomerase 2 family)